METESGGLTPFLMSGISTIVGGVVSIDVDDVVGVDDDIDAVGGFVGLAFAGFVGLAFVVRVGSVVEGEEADD